MDFRVVGDEGSSLITIATTRPELLHACVAVAVNPDDKKYSELVGKTVRDADVRNDSQ